MGHGCHDCGCPNGCECKPEQEISVRGIVSQPGNALEIVCQDRDEWKKLALRAQAEALHWKREFFRVQSRGGYPW